MRRWNLRRTLAMTLSAAQLATGSAEGAMKEETLESYEAYRKVVADTVAMVGDRTAQELAKKHGLRVMNVTW